MFFSLKNITKKPIFWIFTIALSVSSIFFVKNFFYIAFPLVNVKIKMTKNDVIEKADQIAKENNWNKDSKFQTVSIFQNDSREQFFVELEGGGVEAFNEIIKSEIYHPYTWKIRHFQEKNPYEYSVVFTEQGDFYGLSIQLPESQILPNLNSDQANKLAEGFAKEKCKINFANYEKIESSNETKPCARVDHKFVYQIRNKTISKEGKFKLKLEVSGNLVTKIENYIHVPESFIRRHDQLRDVNSLISCIGYNGFYILYFFLGAIIVCFVLIRRNQLIIIPALKCSGLIIFLNILSSINSISHFWNFYQTSISSNSFLIRILISTLISSSFSFIMFFLLIASAESLTRLAFKDDVNLWHLFKPVSLKTIGNLVGGYLYAIIFLAIATITYYVLLFKFKWWAPANALVDPNILSYYFPFLTPLAQSFQAGFFEECAFRAIPIAGSILIGRYFNKEKLFLSIGFILQIIIFASVHANYASLPGYFRLVELIIPSAIFGMLYIKFGLLPGIIAHWIYDYFLMSLPIFTISSNDIKINQLLVILTALSPLIYIFFKYVKNRKIDEISNESKNQFITDTLIENRNKEAINIKPYEYATFNENNNFKKYAVLLLIAVSIFILFSNKYNIIYNLPCEKFRLNICKKDAIDAARKYLIDHGVDTSGYIINAISHREINIVDDFFWQTQNREKYYELLGNYIESRFWKIRFAKFEGDIIERAKEHYVFVNSDGKIVQYVKIIPESESGECLQVDQARELALKHIKYIYSIEKHDLKEISAIDSKKTNRKDWEFVFNNKTIKLNSGGQARICVKMCGDQITNIYKNIFICESWTREYFNLNSMNSLFIIGFSLILFILIGLGFYVDRKDFLNINIFNSLKVWLVLMMLELVKNINDIPNLISFFQTSKSLNVQLITFFTSSISVIIYKTLIFSIFLSYFYEKYRSNNNIYNQSFYCYSILLGIFSSISIVLLRIISLNQNPLIPSFSGISSSISSLSMFSNFIIYSIILIIFLSSISRSSKVLKEKNRAILIPYLWAISGILIINFFSIYQTESISIISGIIFGLILYKLNQLVFNYNQFFIIIFSIVNIFSTYFLINFNFYNGFFGSVFINLLVVMLILILINKKVWVSDELV